MREIKFRAWDKGHNVMRDIQKMSFKNGKMMPYKWNMWFGEETLSKPMQYTGLKDKNGVEIYEGDIIQELKINWEVVFYKGAWRLKRNIDGDIWWKSLYRYVANRKCTVIGSIYTTPELLKESE